MKQSTRLTDVEERILQSLNLLVPEGQVFEIRILGYDDGRGYGSPQILGGFFNDPKIAAKKAAKYDGCSNGVYMTLNPVNPDLMARCYNRIARRKDENDGKTSDKDIVSRTLLPLDYDPARVSGISSTDLELDSALQKRDKVVSWLMKEKGFPEPIQAMSGNGGHALWDIDLPNDDFTRDTISLFYKAINQLFNDDIVKTDCGIFNAGRIWKLFGTLARKGDDVPGRPHRRSEITSIPKERHFVTLEQIKSVADMYVPEIKPTKGAVSPAKGVKGVQASKAQPSSAVHPASGTKFDLEHWMSDHGITYNRQKSSSGHEAVYVLSICPFNSDHTNGSAVITRDADGKIGFKCHHNGCLDYNWRKLRDMMEPESRERREAYENDSRAPKDYKTSHIVNALACLGYTFQFNELTGRVDVNGEPITDPIDATIITAMYDLGYKEAKIIRSVILAEAYKTKYHPIKDYLSGLVWDGQPHIKHLADLIQDGHDAVRDHTGNELKVIHLYLKRWLVGAVAKVLRREQNAMLVMVGKQGIGKSTLASWLCSGMGLEYFSEEGIDPDSKDHQFQCSEKFIWEPAELGAITRRRDVESLKNFLSKKSVSARKSYGHYNITLPTVASFFGSVNPDGAGFLTDSTGSRRFMAVNVLRIDLAYRNLDVNQVWAEAIALFQADEPFELVGSEKTIREELNAQHQKLDPREEWINKWFMIDTTDKNSYLSATAILEHLINMNCLSHNANPDQELAKLGGALTKMHIERKQRRVDGVRGWYYEGISKKLPGSTYR